MIVFQVLNVDPVKEILKIRYHIYILLKKVIILRKIHVEMKSFAPPQKETKHIHATDADLLHTVLVQETSIGANAKGVLRIKVFKISQNSQETPAPEETPVNFAKSLRNPYLQNNSGRLLPKCGYFNNEARDIARLYLLQRAGCIALLLWLKSQSAREASHHPVFMEICPAISHGYQSYLADHLIDEFPFQLLVQLNETKRPGEYQVLSFCFWG